MASLVDQFCPNVHDAPITGATYDPRSGTIATADAAGVVAIQRPGEATPQLVFQPIGPINGAIDLIAGGSHIAIGDINGTIGVYRTDDGQPIFSEPREGARGRVRAFQGVAINPQASMLASISKDHLIRIWDLNRMERVAAWQGFSGDTVEFDRRGERLLAMDDDGQPKLMDLLRVSALHMDKLQTRAERAVFSRDGTIIIAAGPAGLSLLRVADGAMLRSFATQGGSGIINLRLAPEADQIGIVTRRSVHIFSLPELQQVTSIRHGAPNTSGACYWPPSGVMVAGSDGLMHNGSASISAGPVLCVGGFGEHRLAAHSNHVAYWNGGRRQTKISLGEPVSTREVHVDRDGRWMIAVPDNAPIQIFNCQSGKRILEGGAKTAGAKTVCVGGMVAAFLLREGGIRWWQLDNNRGKELAWPTAMALSKGGDWLGVVTPMGYVHILDSRTGRDALPPPEPLADCPIKQLTFVNRRPELLVLDEEGVLGHYDLAESARGGGAAVGRDVITINVPVDRIWGISGGRYCAMRLPDQDTATILWVDIQASEVIHEVTGLAQNVWVDADNGLIIEPGRSSAILEREMDGSERRVLRTLPDDQWISFGDRGIIEASAQAAGRLR
jgi:hypothetical protein